MWYRQMLPPPTPPLDGSAARARSLLKLGGASSALAVGALKLCPSRPPFAALAAMPVGRGQGNAVGRGWAVTHAGHC